MAKKTVKAKIPGHKDPVRYPVILKYEEKFYKNFEVTSKLIVAGIKKKLKEIQRS